MKPKVAHCFFEQSGTFKKAFTKLGIKSFDYDISNEFKQTDFVVDLFDEIERAYEGRRSVFDKIKSDDLIIAFFPCTYFSTCQNMFYTLDAFQYRKIPLDEAISNTCDRLHRRNYYHIILFHLVACCFRRGIPLIIENPAKRPNYLLEGNFPSPTFIDWDRTQTGDYFKKPTAYWFFGCKPELFVDTYCKPIKKFNVKQIHGFERSLISPEYAYHFVAQKILGLPLVVPGSLIQEDLFK